MKLGLKYIIVLGMMLIPLSGCLEEVSPEILSGSPLVVINGIITDEEGPYYVRVTKSSTELTDFNTNNANGSVTLTTIDGKIIHTPVTDAIVTITDDEGNVDSLELSKRPYFNAAQADTWGELGFYQTTSDMIGRPGTGYTLKVTIEGQEYVSVATMPQSPPEITEVGFEGMILTEGQPLPYDIPFISFDEPQGQENHYRFAYWSHDSSSEGLDQNLFTMLFDDVIILDDRFLRPKVEKLSFADALVEGQGLEPIFGDFTTVYMYSIEKDVFEYYEALQQQLRNDGGAFSPAPASPPSNIGNGALGLWQASSISKKTVSSP